MTAKTNGEGVVHVSHQGRKPMGVKLVPALLLLGCGPALAQINNWSDFQRACNREGMDAVKATGSQGPRCVPRISGGAATAGGAGLTPQQQMGLQIWDAVLQGLISNPNPEQQRLQREEQQRRKIEAQQAEIRRLEQEAQRQNEIQARLMANMRGVDSSGSQLRFRMSDSPAAQTAVPMGVAPSSAGLHFRFGEDSQGARSALEQLQQAAGSGREAAGARNHERAADTASAVFDRPGTGARMGVEAPERPAHSPREHLAALRTKLETNRTKHEQVKRELDELKRDANPAPEKRAAIEEKERQVKQLKEEKEFLDLSIRDETGLGQGAAGPAATTAPQ